MLVPSPEISSIGYSTFSSHSCQSNVKVIGIFVDVVGNVVISSSFVVIFIKTSSVEFLCI